MIFEWQEHNVYYHGVDLIDFNLKNDYPFKTMLLQKMNKKYSIVMYNNMNSELFYRMYTKDIYLKAEDAKLVVEYFYRNLDMIKVFS